MARDDNGDWTPYIPNVKKPVVTVSGSNDEALGVENLNGEVLHAAGSFYRKQAAQQGNGIGQYSNKVIEQKFTDGSSAIFRYQYNFGAEHLSIRWSAPKPVPPIEIPKEVSIEEYAIPDLPTLWVFHGGNEITAFVMGHSGLKKVRHKTCRRSSWGYDRLLTSEFKFGGLPVVMSPLHRKGGALLVGSNHYLTFCSISDASLRAFKETSIPIDTIPFMNGNNRNIYTLKGTPDAVPIMVDSDGTYYYAWICGSPQTVVSGADETKYPVPKKVTDRKNEIMVTTYYGGGGEETPQICYFLGSGKDGNIDITEGWLTAYFDNDLNGHLDGTLSYDAPVPVYTIGDSVRISSIHVDVTGDASWNRLGLGGTYNMTKPVSGHYHWEGVDVTSYAHSGEIVVVSIMPFPPSLGIDLSSMYYNIMRLPVDSPDGSPSGPAINKTYTPYSEHDVAADKFKPWLHVSNGEHFIQGYAIEGTAYLYYDRQDMSSMLGDINVSDIQTIIMDVPLSRIDEIA